MQDVGAKTSVAIKDFGEKATTTMQDVGAKTSVAMKDFGEKATTTMQDVGAKTSVAMKDIGAKANNAISNLKETLNQPEQIQVVDELKTAQTGGAVTYRKLFDTNKLVENSQFENTNNFIKFLSFIKQKEEGGYELPEEIIKTIDSGKPYNNYSSPHLLFYMDNNTNDYKGCLFYDLNKSVMYVSQIFNILDDVSETLNDEIIKIIDSTPRVKTIKINNTNSNLIEKMKSNDNFKNSDENEEGYTLFVPTKVEQPKPSFFKKNPFAKKQDVVADPIIEPEPEPTVLVNSDNDKIKEVKDALDIAISSIVK
jgi:hypothetical protein